MARMGQMAGAGLLERPVPKAPLALTELKAHKAGREITNFSLGPDRRRTTQAQSLAEGN
jgi:hypothetical protein